MLMRTKQLYGNMAGATGQIGLEQSNFPATPSAGTFGAALTASATPHTKGAYVTLIASTGFDVSLIVISVSGTNTSAAQTDVLMDIALGAASSEVVLIPSLPVGYHPSTNPVTFRIPIFIPSGTRISANIQSNTASQGAVVAIKVYGGSNMPNANVFTGCDAYGASLATSAGVLLTAGTPAGTEGTAVSIGSALSRDYTGLMLSAGGNSAVNTMAAEAFHIEAGYGSFTPLIELAIQTTSAEVLIYSMQTLFPINVSLPSGTQMQGRIECQNASKAYEAILHCFY